MTKAPLTKGRARLVNRRSACLSRPRHLAWAKNLSSAGAKNPTAAVCAHPRWPMRLRAVLGAIFLDGGYDKAREFVLREFHKPAQPSHLLPPTSIIRRANYRRCSNPVPPVRRIIPDHFHHRPRPTTMDFECVVQHNGQRAGAGPWQKQKREAETEAAFAALQLLKFEFLKPCKTDTVVKFAGRRNAEHCSAGGKYAQLHVEQCSARSKLYQRENIVSTPSARRSLASCISNRCPARHAIIGRIADIIKFAVADAIAYERGGAHALFIENFGDVRLH